MKNGYVVKNEFGDYILDTFSSKEEDAIDEYVIGHLGGDLEWDGLEDEGFKCVQVSLVEHGDLAVNNGWLQIETNKGCFRLVQVRNIESIGLDVNGGSFLTMRSGSVIGVLANLKEIEAVLTAEWDEGDW